MIMLEFYNGIPTKRNSERERERETKEKAHRTTQIRIRSHRINSLLKVNLIDILFIFKLGR